VFRFIDFQFSGTIFGVEVEGWALVPPITDPTVESVIVISPTSGGFFAALPRLCLGASYAILGDELGGSGSFPGTGPSGPQFGTGAEASGPRSEQDVEGSHEPVVLSTEQELAMARARLEEATLALSLLRGQVRDAMGPKVQEVESAQRAVEEILQRCVDERNRARMVAEEVMECAHIAMLEDPSASAEEYRISVEAWFRATDDYTAARKELEEFQGL
jgi:hypothetical protein